MHHSGTNTVVNQTGRSKATGACCPTGANSTTVDVLTRASFLIISGPKTCIITRTCQDPGATVVGVWRALAKNWVLFRYTVTDACTNNGSREVHKLQPWYSWFGDRWRGRQMHAVVLCVELLRQFYITPKRWHELQHVQHLPWERGSFGRKRQMPGVVLRSRVLWAIRSIPNVGCYVLHGSNT